MGKSQCSALLGETLWCVLCRVRPPGGGRDPGGVGASGASEEPAHPRAEEDPQRGQLAVRTAF